MPIMSLLFQTKPQPLQEQTARNDNNNNNNNNNAEQLHPSPIVVATLSSSSSIPCTRSTTKASDDDNDDDNDDDSSPQQQQQHVVVVVQTVQSPPHDSLHHDHHDPHHHHNPHHHNDGHHDDDHHKLHRWQAMMHLIKGNLGPGCLNLPAAFGSTGWALAVALFALVACQGIYSMWLLVQCKRALQRTTRHPQQSSPPQTFMQVAHVALGRVGSRTTEIFLFILQTGVCCVFLSLVQTNLAVAAANILSDGTATALVTGILLVMTVLRFLTDLTWTSTTANVVMMVTIATAATAGWKQYIQNINNNNNNHHDDNDNNNDDNNDTSRNTNTTPAVIVDPHAIIQFFPAMFFAFEGIGLVLPIENAYATTTTTSTTTTTTTRNNNTHTISSTSSTCSFETVLIQSMCITAALFGIVGVFASMGFDDLHEGSVTAYLQATFPHNTWYAVLNAAVMMAVLLTFPLQLQPAMQVLDQWLDQDLTCCCCRRRRRRQGQQRVRRLGVLPLATTEEQAQQTEQQQQQQQAAIGHDHGDRRDNDNDDDDDDSNNNDLPLTIPAVRMELPHPESTGNFQLMERTHSQDELDHDLFLPKDTNNNHALVAVDHEPDGLVRVGYYSSSGSSTTASSFLDPLDATWCCGIPQWLVRRWIVVLACAVIVLWTDDLSLLIGIFGAIGQTGLAAMPCAIDLALQYQGVVPYSWWKTCLHTGILLFCVAVMISSLAAYAR